MIKRIAILIFILITQNVIAQNQGAIWYFGNNAGLDFNTTPPTILTNGQLATQEGCASIADAGGALLFYTDGTSAWGKNHVLMPSLPLGGLGGNSSSTESAIIVPKPGTSNIFYIFTTPATGGGGFKWATVDMTLNGGNGDITSSNNILHDPTCERICAVGDCGGATFWVMAHPYLSDTFYAYKITSTGIAPPVKTKIGLAQGTGTSSIGYMKFSPDGSKLGCALWAGLDQIEIYDFDFATGILSNLITEPLNSAYGCSFSPDNSKIYFSTNDSVYQYDMSLGTGPAILASKTRVGPSIYSGMQCGNNGKMYVSISGSTSLNVINFPNLAGVACGYTVGGQSIAPNTCSLGLPAIIENYLGSGGIPCKMKYFGCNGLDSINFNSAYNTQGATYLWNFGDPGSGVNNTSTIANPLHVFSTVNSFAVTLIINSTCGTDTLVKTVVVDSIPKVLASQNDTMYCTPGSKISIKANAFPLGGSYAWTPVTAINCTICDSVVVNPLVSTNYVVKYTGVGGCIATDTIKLKIRPLPNVSLNIAPDSVCLATAIAPSLIGTTNFINWIWNFNDGTFVNGNTNASHTYLNSGVHQVNVYIADTLGCVDTLVKKVFIDNPNKAHFTVLDDSVCVGEPIALADTLNATYNFTYDFKDGFIMNNISDPIHIYSTPGTYNIVQSIKNIKCPNSTFNKNVFAFAYPVVNLGTDTVICPDVTVPFAISVNSGNCLWNTGATTNNILISEPGTYFVTVNNLGCATSDTIEVKRDCYLNIPNSFTPNGDNLNDYFLPRQLLSSGVTGFTLNIFNRWGENIFTTNNINGRGWDGKYGDKAQPMGVYVYNINVVFRNGVVKNYVGNVTLIR
jgi:gliding motility-associated-like protein